MPTNVETYPTALRVWIRFIATNLYVIVRKVHEVVGLVPDPETRMRGRNLSKHALEISIPHPKTGRTQTALTYTEHLLQVLHGRVLCPQYSLHGL